jgi:hypothetical protein
MSKRENQITVPLDPELRAFIGRLLLRAVELIEDRGGQCGELGKTTDLWKFPALLGDQTR